MEKARVWKFGNDVDTDQIIASQYIILPTLAEMAPHAFESLDAGFAAGVKPGDVVLGGENFGCGSSREQAPGVLKALGVRAVVAKSVARIFYRNAINIGLPVVLCADVYDAVQPGDTLGLDLAEGLLEAGGQRFTATRLPQHMQNILAAGGLIESLNAEADAPAPGAQAQTAPAATAAPMTMAEKIIARAAGVPAVKAGEIHTITLDRLMSNDGTTHMTIDAYNSKLKQPRLAAPGKLVFIIDHNSPADTPKTAAAHRKMRDFAKKNNITFYEGKGVCHQLMMENHVQPGEFIIGADSHTCSYGALGAFGTGVGSTDFLYGMVTGQTWVMVPETVRFVLNGRLRPGVTPRDLMLTIIGDVGADGCNYQVMEFVGDGIAAMAVEDRMVLANLAVEAGAKTALMEPDDKTLTYLEQRRHRPQACDCSACTPDAACPPGAEESRGGMTAALFSSDADATFAATHTYQLEDIVPVVARPDHIDDVVPAADALGVPIDEAFLGSCNNGRIGDLRAAAAILKGRKVHPLVRFIVSPASNEVYAQALREGIITTLNDAGAQVVNANCSVCWGSCQGVIGPGEVLISTGTRNFKGRAGHKDSKVYLGSAETVAASAVAGAITTADML